MLCLWRNSITSWNHMLPMYFSFLFGFAKIGSLTPAVSRYHSIIDLINILCLFLKKMTFSLIGFFAVVVLLLSITFLTYSNCVFHISVVLASFGLKLLLLLLRNWLFLGCSLVTCLIVMELVVDRKVWDWWIILGRDDHIEVVCGMSLVLLLSSLALFINFDSCAAWSPYICKATPRYVEDVFEFSCFDGIFHQ